MRQLRVATFGCLRFHIGDSEIKFSTRKTAALLAYLAMQAGRRIARETLCGLLWGERSEMQARHSLSQALSEIRRAVGDDLVRSDGRIVWIDPSLVWVDAFELTQLTGEKTLSSLDKAQALYQGDFLSFGELNQERFDDWLISERERLRQVAQSGLTTALSLRTQDTDTEARLNIARMILALDPFDERAHRAVMNAYAAQGNTSLAMDHYHRLTRSLRDELGVEPDQDTQRTFKSIAERSRPSPLSPKTLEEYAFVLEQLPHPVVVTDLQSHIVGWNALAETMYEITKSDILGRTPAVFLAPDHDPAQARTVLKCALREGLWSRNVSILCNGTPRRQRRIVAPIYTPAGEAIGAFGHGVIL